MYKCLADQFLNLISKWLKLHRFSLRDTEQNVHCLCMLNAMAFSIQKQASVVKGLRVNHLIFISSTKVLNPFLLCIFFIFSEDGDKVTESSSLESK